MTNDKLVERHLSIKVRELNVFNPARRLHFFQLSWREVTLFESDIVFTLFCRGMGPDSLLQD